MGREDEQGHGVRECDILTPATQTKRTKYGPLAERLKKWQRDKTLVEEGHRCIDHPLHIRQPARAALSLNQMGLSCAAISDMIGMEPEVVLLILASAKSSTNPVLIKVVQFGLPRWAASPLPYGKRVRCQKCNNNINHVPCIKCGPNWGTPPVAEDVGVKGVRVAPNLDPNPTRTDPGSQARIEVYRSRIERGLAVFHDEDRPE